MPAKKASPAAKQESPTRTRSMAELAYEQLKRRIVACELPPGLQVTESALVDELNIGKTPVREALARLVQDGLVRNIPRHGYLVTPITLRDVQHLFGLRLVVEPAAVQLAAGHVDARHLRRLDQLCRAGYRLGDHSSALDFLKTNRELHGTIARASGNPRLAEVVEQVLDESDRLLLVGLMLRDRTNEMAHEHRELLDALAAGKADLAREIAAEQILLAQRMVTDALISTPAVLAAPVRLTRRVPASA